VAVYAGVDGVSYSTGAERFGAYPGYADRVVAVTLAQADLDALAERLAAAGVGGSNRPPDPTMLVPPQTYTFLVYTNRGTRQMRYWHARGSEVPESLLVALETLPGNLRPALIDQLIAANRSLGRAPQ
jgi:hypothetical protein